MGYGHHGELIFGYRGRILDLDIEEVDDWLDKYAKANPRSTLKTTDLWTEWSESFDYVLHTESFSNETISSRRFGYSFPDSIPLPTKAEDIAAFSKQITASRKQLEDFYGWLLEQHEFEDELPEPQWILTSCYS